MMMMMMMMMIWGTVNTLSCVRADGCYSDWFIIGSDVLVQGYMYVVAADLFLTPMHWLLNRRPTVHVVFLGSTIGTEPFMVLISLTTLPPDGDAINSSVVTRDNVLSHEAKAVGLQFNWLKTKIDSNC